MIATGRFLLIAALAGLAASASLSVSRLKPPANRAPASLASSDAFAESLLVSCASDKAVLTQGEGAGAWCDVDGVCHDSLDAAMKSACK